MAGGFARAAVPEGARVMPKPEEKIVFLCPICKARMELSQKDVVVPWHKPFINGHVALFACAGVGQAVTRRVK